MLIWRSPNCQIPHNTEWISRKLQRPFDDIEPIMTEFCDVKLNTVTQKRLQKEMHYLRERSKKQSERAKVRWNNDNDVCRGNAEPHQSGNAPTPTPTPNITPIVPKGDFDSFWKLYPSKVGKANAVRKYNKAIKEASHEEIMAGLSKYCRCDKVSKGYIQNPSTWLNGGHWKDEYTEAASKKKGPALC